MKNITLSLLLFLSLAGICAENSLPIHKKKSEMSAQELQAARAELEARTGGMVLVGQEGMLKCVNFQHSVDQGVLNEISKGLSKVYRIDFVSESNDEKFELKFASTYLVKSKANACVYVVDEASLPLTLLSLEAKWALVNVAALTTDKPTQEKLNKRVQKLIMRMSAFLLGAGNSSYKGSVLDGYFEASDFDAKAGTTIMPDSLMSISHYVNKLGITQGRVISYRRACIDGLAKAPTNEIQKAIWDKVRAEKERGPTNAILIKP